MLKSKDGKDKLEDKGEGVQGDTGSRDRKGTRSSDTEVTCISFGKEGAQRARLSRVSTRPEEG